jgi:hypothetical protein
MCSVPVFVPQVHCSRPQIKVCYMSIRCFPLRPYAPGRYTCQHQTFSVNAMRSVTRCYSTYDESTPLVPPKTINSASDGRVSSAKAQCAASPCKHHASDPLRHRTASTILPAQEPLRRIQPTKTSHAVVNLRNIAFVDSLQTSVQVLYFVLNDHNCFFQTGLGALDPFASESSTPPYTNSTSFTLPARAHVTAVEAQKCRRRAALTIIA